MSVHDCDDPTVCPVAGCNPAGAADPFAPTWLPADRTRRWRTATRPDRCGRCDVPVEPGDAVVTKLVFVWHTACRLDLMEVTA